MKSKKMGMKSNFIEPNKELKFGGKPMKYGPGGEKKTGMGSTAGRSANYESRNAKAEKESKDYYSSLSMKEKLTLSAEEKAKLAEERNSKDSNTSGPSWTAEQRQQARLDAQRQARNTNKNSSNEASVSPRAKAQNTPQGSSAKDKQGNVTTSQTRQASGSGAGNAPKSTPRPARMQEAAKGKTAKSVQGSGAKAELQTRSSAPKQAAAEIKSEPTSKRASRINRRTEKVEARKSAPSRMDRKADRINKRADRVESRKAKKSEVSAAKARLKAARRLQDGGLKTPSADQKGLKKLPTSVRNKMGYKKYGGAK